MANIVNGLEIKAFADLRGSNLRGADLCYANLAGSILRGADLCCANLTGSNLCYTDLRDADLTGANLCYANLCYADLRGADLTDANLPRFQITPKGYMMYGFKKLSNGTIAVLEIPAEAGRTATLVSCKCRAEYVKVVSGEGYDRHTGRVYYKPGDVIYPDKYDDDIRVECTHGIHFFQTYEEAEEY